MGFGCAVFCCGFVQLDFTHILQGYIADTGPCGYLWDYIYIYMPVRFHG